MYEQGSPIGYITFMDDNTENINQQLDFFESEYGFVTKQDFLESFEKEELPKGVPFVEIQAGKGKKDDSSTYILAEEFTYIEGIIWDKHREYGMSRKSKFPQLADHNKIMSEFKKRIKDVKL